MKKRGEVKERRILFLTCSAIKELLKKHDFIMEKSVKSGDIKHTDAQILGVFISKGIEEYEAIRSSGE